MNSSNCIPAGQEGPEPDFLAVDVLLIYEDLGTGLRARHAFEGAVNRIDMPADFKVDLWRFDLLSDSALWEPTLSQAAKAGVIVVSAHGRTGLPASVEQWLNQWMDRKSERPCALVLSLDQEMEASPSADRILAFLQGRARQAGIEMFAHFGQVPEPEGELTLDCLQRRAHARTAILDDILRRPSAPSHWDLNQ
jgi:hypothetical protein